MSSDGPAKKNVMRGDANDDEDDVMAESEATYVFRASYGRMMYSRGIELCDGVLFSAGGLCRSPGVITRPSFAAHCPSSELLRARAASG